MSTVVAKVPVVDGDEDIEICEESNLTFFGKPVSYWIELEKEVEKNKYRLKKLKYERDMALDKRMERIGIKKRLNLKAMTKEQSLEYLDECFEKCTLYEKRLFEFRRMVESGDLRMDETYKWHSKFFTTPSTSEEELSSSSSEEE